MIARLSLIGFSPSDHAITGNAVEMTVESSSSMNSAHPTISGASCASERFRRFGFIDVKGERQVYYKRAAGKWTLASKNLGRLGAHRNSDRARLVMLGIYFAAIQVSSFTG